MGLLSLMLLHDSRRNARVDADGSLVPLENQDRGLWLEPQIVEGVSLVETALACGTVGPYQVQAAISAVHAEAATMEASRWQEIIVLYDLLDRMRPNPVVRLNRAVAVSYAASADAALVELETLSTVLDSYQPFHATLADCLRRAGRREEAIVAYARAVALSANPRERDFLRRRLFELE